MARRPAVSPCGACLSHAHSQNTAAILKVPSLPKVWDLFYVFTMNTNCCDHRVNGFGKGDCLWKQAHGLLIHRSTYARGKAWRRHTGRLEMARKHRWGLRETWVSIQHPGCRWPLVNHKVTSRHTTPLEQFNRTVCFNGEQSTSHTGDGPQTLASLSSPCPWKEASLKGLQLS